MSATQATFRPVENARPANAAFKAARLPFASRDRGVTFKSGRSVTAPPLQMEMPQADAHDTPEAISTEAPLPPQSDAVPVASMTQAPSAEETVNQDTIASIRAEAYAAGVAAARADAMAELETARDVFVAAHTALLDTPGQLEELTAQIEKAVLRLASDRAGLAIDTTPAAFLSRIEQLATTISDAMETLSVMLNPADLNAIAPHLQDSQCKAIRFKADPALSRGDARLETPLVMLDDLLGSGS